MKVALVVFLTACLASVDSAIWRKRRQSFLQSACQLSLWETASGYQYAYNDRREDFATAQASCEACGASLTSVHSSEENNFIRSLAPPGESLFIGFTDQRVESQWLWLDGTGADYKNWRAGSKASLAEPDDADTEGQANADCAYMTANGVWRDLLCSSPRRSVCKRALPVLTTASEPEAPLPPKSDAPQTEVPLPLETKAPQPSETEAPLPLETKPPQTEAPLLPETDAPQTEAPLSPEIEALLPPVTESPKPLETEAPLPPQTEAPLPPQTEAPLPPQTEAPLPPQTEAPLSPQMEAPLSPETTTNTGLFYS